MNSENLERYFLVTTIYLSKLARPVGPAQAQRVLTRLQTLMDRPWAKISQADKISFDLNPS
jgi:hypothetical protein